MADRRPGVGLGPVALGGVLVAGAVHLVEPLGLAVPGLEIVVAERPGRRQAVQVVDLPEVLGPKPVQGGAVKLGRPAHEVVDLGLERRGRHCRTTCRREMYFPSTKTASGLQLSISRGKKSPRSSSRIRLPDGASVWARVPPPAPVPMMMTS